MQFPKKAKVQVAAVKRNTFDKSNQYIGTLDFGKLVPTLIQKTIPNEKYRVEPMTFMRAANMVVPTFGRVDMHFNTFFVPMHTIWAQWNNLLTKEKYVNSSGTSYDVSKIPYFLMSQLQSLLFTDATFSDRSSIPLKADYYTKSIFSRALIDHQLLDISSSAITWDFCTGVSVDENGKADTVTVVTLTSLGRYVYNLLLSLGYQVPCVLDNTEFVAEADLDYIEQDDVLVSVLPILAFAKIYIDWFQSNQFTLNSSIRQLCDKIRLQNYGTAVSSADLKALLIEYRRCFECDLYTSSWLTPNSDSNLSSLSVGVLPSSIIGTVSSNSSAGAKLTTSVSNQPQISMLQRFQQFLDRWRVGGFRDNDRSLAEFGVKSKDVNYHRSMLINSYSQELMISDVMSNASTAGAELGDYAGKGLSYGSDKWQFETDDYGYLLTIASIVPKTGYVYGLDRNHLDLTLLDQFTPEFDNVGVEAIPMNQLSNPQNCLGGGVAYDSVFGYVPRYGHVKVSCGDKLCGDFRIPTLSTGTEAWHLFRRDYGEDIGNNESFRQITQRSDPYGAQCDDFDRIFATGTDASVDHFWFFANYKIIVESPMRSIVDNILPVYDGESHREVGMSYNGTQL